MHHVSRHECSPDQFPVLLIMLVALLRGEGTIVPDLGQCIAGSGAVKDASHQGERQLLVFLFDAGKREGPADAPTTFMSC